jgi:hypothetical protein
MDGWKDDSSSSYDDDEEEEERKDRQEKKVGEHPRERGSVFSCPT